MSLNWKEIDLIISEIHFKEARIQEIYQPTLKKVYVELYVNKALQRLLINLEQGQVGMYLIDKKLHKPQKPQRFQQLLQSRIVGMYIHNISQINQNRIVLIHLRKKKPYDSKKQKPTDLQKEYVEQFLYCKLWSNNSNIIITNTSNGIVDTLYRSKKQNIMPHQIFIIPPQQNTESHLNKTIRTWDPQLYNNSFNTFICEYYTNQNTQIYKTKTLENIKKNVQKQILFNIDKVEALRSTLKKYKSFQRYEEYGNAILSHLHTMKQSQETLTTKLYNIPLNTTLTPIKNAEYYFKKAKKINHSLEITQEHLAQIESTLQYLSNLQSLIPQKDNLPIPEKLLSFYSSQKGQSLLQENKTQNRLRGYTKTILKTSHALILIGKNAKENDALLRNFARGEDTWFHVRENKGAFVFVRLNKNPRIHTIPLNLLLEYANLAALYSKVKNNSTIEVYYTKVKHLRRIKGAIGLVIPSHEKTLHIVSNNEKAKKFIGDSLLSP